MSFSLRQRILPPALFLISLTVMVALHWACPGKLLVQGWLPRGVGLLFGLGGLAMTMLASRQFSQVGTNINTFGQPDQLVASGLFRYTRNPMYLGFALALLGAAIFMGSVTPFLGLFLFVAITDRWYIAFEERAMHAKFGAAYLRYQQHTRRWF